ncbi:MAG: CidA/LrgA family protein [Acetobacteraceae bacterium]
MVRGLLVLILADLLGEGVRHGLGIPASGAVLGMVLLLLLFLANRGIPAAIETASRPLLKHLSLLFVPAAAGMMGQASLIGRYWLVLAVALLGSAVIGLLATAASLHVLGRLSQTRPAPRGAAEETP